MTDQFSFPPLRDLPPGHHEARKQHLLAEIEQQARRGPRLPAIGLTPMRLAGVAVAGAAAAVAVALLSISGGGVAPGKRVVAPRAPVWAFHASLSSPVLDNRAYSEHGQSGLSPTAASRAVGRPQGVPALVYLLARREATLNGNRHPTLAQWLKTTRQVAVSTQSADRVDGGRRPVYLVVLHGHFVDKNAYYLRRGKKGSNAGAPRGTVLTFTIDVKKGGILDFALGNGAPHFPKGATPHAFTFGLGRSR